MPLWASCACADVQLYTFQKGLPYAIDKTLKLKYALYNDYVLSHSEAETYSVMKEWKHLARQYSCYGFNNIPKTTMCIR